MSIKRLDLGAVSAYALAVEQGYQGTEEEFGLILANAANYASDSKDAKEAAENAAGEAAESARFAGIKLEEVNTAASERIKEIEDKAAEQKDAAKADIAAKGKEVLESIPEDYQAMQEDVSELKEDLGDLDNGYKVIGSLIDEQYVKSNGSFSKYTGWSRTDFISCEGMDKLYIVSPQCSGSRYNAFYAEKDTASFISYFNIKSNDVAEISVPEGAKYFVLSNEADVIRNTHIKSRYHNRLVKAEESISRHEAVLEQIKNQYVLYETYPDSYIKYDSGEVASFKGWTSTGFISCEGKSEIGIIIDVSGSDSVRSNAFYAEADYSSFITNFKTPNTGYNKIRVPDGAKYFAISNDSATMKTLKIVDDTANLLKGVKATSSFENCDTSIYRRGNLLPEYYFTMLDSADSASFDDNEYLEGKIAEAGKDAFIYICDTHWKSNAQQSNMLIGYVKKRLGIRNVLFGGDILNQETSKYAALVEMKKYINDARSVCGKHFFVAQGNHDINTANAGDYTDEELANAMLPYSEVVKATLKECESIIVQETENRILERLSSYTIAEEDKVDMIAYFKMHYYYDDPLTSTRFIILQTGNTRNGIVKKYFGVTNSSELYLQMDWLAQTLHSTPSGYNIVLCGHVLINWKTNLLGDVQLKIGEMLSSLKTKSSVTISGPTTELMQSFYGSGEHVYDFTDANTIGKILCVSGDAHWDAACLAKSVEGVFTSVPYAPDEVTDDSILFVMTQCDAYKSSNYHPSNGYIGDCYAMESGTTTEQCFDIVSINTDSIDMVRIGAGKKRRFMY